MLLLVGTFEEFDEAQAVQVGADANLKKPFDSQELLSQVEGLLTAGASVAEAPAPPAVEASAAPLAAPSPETMPLAATTVPTVAET
ncbi:MAG: response regulator, partial [Acidobacteriota bacterium]